MRDVFISYSHKDIKWVMDFLIPMLESWQVEFVNYRDFLPGGLMVSRIHEFINTSKHVLFICTPSFLASQPCQDEVQQAVSEDPESSNDKAVPVVLDTNAVPPLLMGLVWCNLFEQVYDTAEWKKLCNRLGGKWSPASDDIVARQNDLSLFFGNIRDNRNQTIVLVRSHSVRELTGIRNVLSADSARGLSHIYVCLAEVGKTKGIRLVLSDGDGNLSDQFDENEPMNLIIFGQTSQGNSILYRISNGLIRYKQTSEVPQYCYEIKGNLFVPNQDHKSFVIYKSRTVVNNTVLVLFSPWPYANGLVARYFAENYWTFVNKEHDSEFLNIYEVKGVDKDPVLVLSER